MRASRVSVAFADQQTGQILDELGVKPDIGQCWADAAKTRKLFQNRPKTSVSDRLGRVDARRRRKAIEKHLQKIKEAKLKRFNSLPQREREHISDAFEKFDLDESGELDKDEVVQCLKEFGLSGITSEETRAIIDICGDASVADDQFPVYVSAHVEFPDQVVAVALVDFALTVIPRVRRKLQEMRSEALLRHFRMFDYDQKGYISIDSCHQISKELGVDVCIFDECFQAEEDSDEDGEQDQIHGPTTISFETFQSVVFAAREKGTRDDRQRERQIQECYDLSEETFQEFREDLRVLQDLFERFDGDKSGCLDIMEVTFMLKDFGLLPQDPKERETVFQIMHECDHDGSGEFEFDEFLGLVHQIRDFAIGRNKDELLYFYERYDRDGSGQLNVAELSVLLTHLGLVPHTRREQEELAHLIHIVDNDGSGFIDFYEFQVLCQRISENMTRLRYESENDQAMELGFTTAEVHDLRFVYDRLDNDCNGRIDKNEAKVCVGLTKIPVNIEAFDESWSILDADHNGGLDWLEFANLMRLLKEREGLFQKEKEEAITWSDKGPRRQHNP